MFRLTCKPPLPPVPSGRYDGPGSSAIEVISPASSPVQPQDKQESSFAQEKVSQGAGRKATQYWPLFTHCIHYAAFTVLNPTLSVLSHSPACQSVTVPTRLPASN